MAATVFVLAVAVIPLQAEDAAQLKQRLAAVRTASGGFGGAAAIVPKEVDAGDASERILLLTPTGPLVIALEITIDGKPYRTDREAFIDSMLKAADTDEDGKPTWKEAMKSPKFLSGRMIYYARNDQMRERFIKQYDKDGNGEIDRYECRLLIAGQYGGPAFSMYNNAYNLPRPDVFKLLDVDGNNTLSEKELSTAGDRLQSRDRNENDILEANEISGAAAGRFASPLRVRGQPMRNKPLLGMIGKSLNVDEAYTALLARYGKDDVLSTMQLTLTPKFARQLDKNKDGRIEKDELAALNEIKPHLRLKIALGETGDQSGGLKVQGISKNLKSLAEVDEIEKGVALTIAGAKIELISGNVNYGNVSYARTAQSILTRYDKDKNGYLEEKELGEDPQTAYLKQQFTNWDADSDGKVYAEEVAKAYQAMARPQHYRVSLAGVDLGGSLFEAVDETGDGRVSLREMRTAGERLKSFDADKDGNITREEVPTTVRVAFARGNHAYSLVSNRYVRTSQGGLIAIGDGRAARGAPNKTAGPEWFARMDTNGDGDVTLKEFLGDEAQFKKLDTNGDGFIERKEAEKAGS